MQDGLTNGELLRSLDDCASHLLLALDAIAPLRQRMHDIGFDFLNEYAAEEWALLPAKIAEAIAATVHTTYTPNEIRDPYWAAWRIDVRNELDKALQRCNPIRIIK